MKRNWNAPWKNVGSQRVESVQYGITIAAEKDIDGWTWVAEIPRGGVVRSMSVYHTKDEAVSEAMNTMERIWKA